MVCEDKCHREKVQKAEENKKNNREYKKREAAEKIKVLEIEYDGIYKQLKAKRNEINVAYNDYYKEYPPTSLSEMLGWL